MLISPVKVTTTARRRGRLAVAALGFAAAASVALAPAASAAPGQTSAKGLSCAGVVTCGPFAVSAYPGGPPSASVVNASVSGLLTTGVINTTANVGGATASVANLSATLLTNIVGNTTLTADAVSSSCTVNPTTGAITGTSSITNGAVKAPIVPAITLAANAAPNTTVSVPGVATITLNRQITDQDGTLHVDAIYIALLGGRLGQNITIATSVCGVPSLATPMVAPVVAIGGGLAAALAVPVIGVAYYRRRQVGAAGARA